MDDLTVELELAGRPEALALLGETLGAAGISVEGGGMFTFDGRAVGHFLFHDGGAARSALERAGIRVTACRRVLARRLDQAKPGQLGAIARALANAGVTVDVLYSDHQHRLILVVDDPDTGATATLAWNG
jgi:hypothetical protein